MNFKMLSLSAALLGLAACSSTPVTPPTVTAPASPPASQAQPATQASQAVPESKIATVTLPAYLDPNNPLSKQKSVYFDYDNFSVKDEYRPLLERHGNFLARQTAVAVKVEGNTDERGGTKYNLALGQKRAEAVVTALKLLGAKSSQLEAISWGKERPKATGHDEAAWAENRRVDLSYPDK